VPFWLFSSFRPPPSRLWEGLNRPPSQTMGFDFCTSGLPFFLYAVGSVPYVEQLPLHTILLFLPSDRDFDPLSFSHRTLVVCLPWFILRFPRFPVSTSCGSPLFVCIPLDQCSSFLTILGGCRKKFTSGVFAFSDFLILSRVSAFFFRSRTRRSSRQIHIQFVLL